MNGLPFCKKLETDIVRRKGIKRVIAGVGENSIMWRMFLNEGKMSAVHFLLEGNSLRGLGRSF